MSRRTSVNFDRIAPAYRGLEYASFGPFLERCRFAQLGNLGNPQHALVLGDGDGRFLARLLATHSTLTADVVDSSRSMLRLLDQRIRRMGGSARDRVRLHAVDALEWQATQTCDLVISHFFLDCLFASQIEALLDRLTPHLAPGAQWIVSEFAIPKQAPASYFSKRIVSLLYRSFGWITGLPVRNLPDYAACLRKRGSKLTRHKEFLGGLLQSQIWQLPAPTVFSALDDPER